MINAEYVPHEFLYQVRDPKTYEVKGHLLGTCHCFFEAYELSSRIKKVLSQAGCLVLELNPKVYVWKKIYNYLSSPEYFRCCKISSDIFSSCFPGMETHLFEAKPKATPLVELETIQEQIKLLLEIFKPYLGFVDGGLEYQKFLVNRKKNEHEMNRLYLKGLKKELIEKGFSSYENNDLREKVLYERNKKMALKIHDLFSQNIKPLVAIGALHLYKEKKGDPGVISLLKKRGWQILPVLNPSDFLKISPHHPRGLEKLLAQSFCTKKMVEEMLAQNATINANALVAATHNTELIKSIVPKCFEQIQVNYHPDYSLTSILKNIKPWFEYLLEDLVMRYPDVSFSSIEAAIQGHFSEAFIYKLMAKCVRKKITKKVGIKIIESLLNRKYSEQFTLNFMQFINFPYTTVV